MSNESTSGKRVLINSVIYSCCGILQKCFSFFLLPLYTAYLTTEDYGINSIATSFIQTMSFVVAFSLFSAIMRFYVDLKNNPEKLRRFYGTVSCFVFISGIFFSILFTIFRKPVSKYIFSGVDFYPIILVCLLALMFNCQQMIFDNIMRSQQKALKSSVCSMFFFLGSVALNVYFVVYCKYGALGTLLASLIGYIIYTAYFWIEMSIKKTICVCLDFGLLKDALKYSVPIMPHNLSTTIALFVSKILIGGKASLAGLGIYSVAAQFGNIADTIQCYVDNAYGPWLYEKLHAKEKDFKNSIRQIVNLLIAVIGLFFLGISLFAHDYIVLFVDKSYSKAWMYVPMIVSVFAIKTAYYFYVEVLFYYKEASKKLFISTLSSSIVNIFLSALLIPFWGVVGSIFADGIAMVLRVLIIIVISRQYEDIGIRVTDFIRNFLIIELFIWLGLSLSFLEYQTVFSLKNFVFKISTVFIYIIYIVVSNKTQVKTFISVVKRKFKGGK